MDPGAEGIAIRTSSTLRLVEDARQIRARVPAHAHPVDAQAALARVIIEKADRGQAEPAVARDLTQHQPPAVSGADDQHAALALADAAQRRQRTSLVDHPREHAHADQEQQAEQPEQHDHAVGQPDRRARHRPAPVHCVALHGAQRLDAHDREQHDHQHRPRHRLEVALAGVAPAPLIHAREHQHEQAAREHPPDRAGTQLGVVAGRTVVEAQLKREVVGERDQRPVHHELGDGPAMQGNGGRCEPSAH